MDIMHGWYVKYLKDFYRSRSRDWPGERHKLAKCGENKLSDNANQNTVSNFMLHSSSSAENHLNFCEKMLVDVPLK